MTWQRWCKTPYSLKAIDSGVLSGASIHGCPDLRVVDMMSDPGAQAILDEGCNMTCHSKPWRKNADQKLLDMGFTMEALG